MSTSLGPCDSDQYCQELYNSTTTRCQGNGECSNPFRTGCLTTRLGESFRRRVCNSDDTDLLYCDPPEFDYYPELRIHQGNWESSMFLAWIYQIVLMELVQVRATVGLTTSDTEFSSFYNPGNTMEYSSFDYPWGALFVGDRESTCTFVEDPCVHVLPEVWPEQSQIYNGYVEQEIIEPPSGNGLLGTEGLHIPVFTAEKYPSFAIWYGLRGEANREGLASTFKRPTTWKEYCDSVSSTDCSEPDGTAERYPIGEEEGELYYRAGLYKGHFRATAKNDCIANPTTCTGHVALPPCDRAVDAQLYWNDIVGLESDGPLYPNRGYSLDQLQQLWYAANATQSHLMMHWYEPDPLPVQFFGTEFEFQMVSMPAPSRECLAARVSGDDRCSADIFDRRGEPEGACGHDIEALDRVIAHSVGQRNLLLDEADQSPAHELLKLIRITNIDMSEMLQNWRALGIHADGNDARGAVCDWVVEHLEDLENFVPSGFPRTKQDRSDYSIWYMQLLVGLGACVSLVSIFAALLVGKYQNTKTMVFAQPFFMLLILLGFCMIGSGGMMHALEPSMEVCTSAAWLTVLGYTVELVPVLVKTAAINKLIHSSKKMKQVNLSRRFMLLEVAVVVLLVLAYLVFWTIVDPSTGTETRDLAFDGTSKTVTIDLKCASTRAAWRLTAFGWQAVLLILAAVLAFQSRDLMKQLNESRSLGMMVYSHFLFVCLRGISSIFYVYDTLPSSSTAALFSLNYSLDALIGMAIYVWPKLKEAMKAPDDYKPGKFSGPSTRASVDELDMDDLDDEEHDDLEILVCTANIGNSVPAQDSMEAMLPLGGACNLVQPLNGMSMASGSFDIIAIGMQEATWTTEKSVKIAGVREEAITEEDILNALEGKHTAALRAMIQDILGDNYRQVADERRGQMRLHIWASRRVVYEISDIRISGANTGIGNMLANKGGIVATLYYKKTRISILSAHLAAHEGESYYKTRCENVRSILREAKTFELSKKFDVSVSSHHMIMMGDLNFRTRFGAENKVEDNVSRALALIDAKDYSSLYMFDELHEGIAEGDLLVDFTTLPCNFPPTFKVEREPGVEYTERRTPSYTDRILYKSAEGLTGNLVQRAYEPCIDFITSDHKPVRGAFSIRTNEKLRPCYLDSDALLVFRKMRCSDLPIADADGKSDPYLMFIWDSVDIHPDKVNIMDKARRLWLEKSWPRTKYIPKTLNPYWKGQRMNLIVTSREVGADAMLYVAAIDFDAVGKDEFLGCVALNVKELVTLPDGETEKTMNFDRLLLREGKHQGRFKFKLDVKLVQNNWRQNLLGNLGKNRSSWRMGRDDEV